MAKALITYGTRYGATAATYGLKPAALGLFGGVYDYNRMPGILKGVMEQMKPQLEAAGVTQTQPGVYDARDMDVIRSWALGLVKLIKM